MLTKVEFLLQISSPARQLEMLASGDEVGFICERTMNNDAIYESLTDIEKLLVFKARRPGGPIIKRVIDLPDDIRAVFQKLNLV